MGPFVKKRDVFTPDVFHTLKIVELEYIYTQNFTAKSFVHGLNIISVLQNFVVE